MKLAIHILLRRSTSPNGFPLRSIREKSGTVPKFFSPSSGLSSHPPCLGQTLRPVQTAAPKAAAIAMARNPQRKPEVLRWFIVIRVVFYLPKGLARGPVRHDVTSPQTGPCR